MTLAEPATGGACPVGRIASLGVREGGSLRPHPPAESLPQAGLRELRPHPPICGQSVPAGSCLCAARVGPRGALPVALSCSVALGKPPPSSASGFTCRGLQRVWRSRPAD